MEDMSASNCATAESRHGGLGTRRRVSDELAERCETVHAVGRNEAIAIGHSNHRVEEAPYLRNDRSQAFGMGLGQLALVRRGHHMVERERGKRNPMTAEWVAVASQDGAAGVLDLAGELRDLGRRRTSRHLGNGQADRARLRLGLALARGFLRRCRCRLGLGRSGRRGSPPPTPCGPAWWRGS